jgi:Tfp pilus assembly protein PilX
MRRPFPKFSRGAIALVALSFVSVLGLVLAGDFAISQQSMRLSSRSYGATVSEQLAELALEEALRAINTNNFADWTSGTAPNLTRVDWTLTAATATATATITPPATRYGNSGVTGTAKIRIDNYDAYNRNATWTAGTAYRIGDLIGYGAVWYRCVQNHTAVLLANRPPNLSFWVPAPIPWQWSSDKVYSPFEIVNSAGTWYRYVNSTASSGNALSDPRFWRAIPSGLPLPTVWSNQTTYHQGSVVSDVVSGDVIWFVYVNAASSSGNPTSNATYWRPTVSGVPWASSSMTLSASRTKYSPPTRKRSGTFTWLVYFVRLLWTRSRANSSG